MCCEENRWLRSPCFILSVIINSSFLYSHVFSFPRVHDSDRHNLTFGVSFFLTVLPLSHNLPLPPSPSPPLSLPLSLTSVGYDQPSSGVAQHPGGLQRGRKRRGRRPGQAVRDEEGLPPAAQRGVYAHALVVRRHAPREGPGMGHHRVLGFLPSPWRDGQTDGTHTLVLSVTITSPPSHEVLMSNEAGTGVR